MVDLDSRCYAGAAHEMATPLATIAVTAKEMEHDATVRLRDHRSQEDAQLIRSQVERCRSILERMGTQGADPFGETPKSTELDALLLQVKEKFPEAQSRIHLCIDEGLSNCLIPVRAAVEALSALVKNALDASPHGKPVVVRAVKVDEGRVRFVIRDEGTGMSPEVMERVAEPFFTMKQCVECLMAAMCGVLICASFGFAQSDAAIRGSVTAKADNSLLPDVEIRLESPLLAEPLGTKSGDNGQFAFQRLVPGPYMIRASREGFQEQTIQLTLKPREIQNITLELSLRGIEQSVEVHAITGLAPTYSPSSTTLQRETIDDLPVDQRNNLPDMIAITAPGMIRSHDDFVHVRGNEIALNTFINGVSFWENPHSVFSAGLSPDIIQSASVMTGGFPAEYGNRFGGVIDIVTKSGLSMNNEGSLT
ncbi:MAG: hypothetical protein DMG14_13920, partial [Acidobacteria bacterium]